MNLVIVESPAKGKTIEKYLGKDYKVLASFGHVRDLPSSKIGVDVKKNFEPTYEIPAKASKAIKALKSATAKADTLYLATDYDREGEAIAYHLIEALKPKIPYKRITFTEITKPAILEAIKKPREIDLNLVDAQQARRVLDRLVGYKLSPFLWKKVAQGLSAGRVQSVAVRLVVEREREIQKFIPEEYWTIEAELSKNKVNFKANLTERAGQKLTKLAIKSEKEAKEIDTQLKKGDYIVSDLTSEDKRRYPSPPFTTSTLQMEAGSKFKYSAKQTMRLAQNLYEDGFITYMRTDSLNVSPIALKQAQEVIAKNYGAKYALEKPRVFKTKSKGAQEAHEAIRPTDLSITADRIPLTGQHQKIYDLIWKKMMASQMQEAIVAETTAKIQNGDFIFTAKGLKVKFDGFMKLYKTQEAIENFIPELKIKDKLDLEKLDKIQHFTEPLPRYSEGSLIKELEKRGIGRPSTYAPTLSTIQDRGYVEKIEGKFMPKDIGLAVSDILVEHFPQIVDYDFTAKMEENLDDIAEGKLKWKPVIKEFYDPFNKNLKEKMESVQKEDLQEETDEKCPKCGQNIVIKMGRFGKFMACKGYPECKYTKPITKPGEVAAEEEVSDEKCPKCGKPMILKESRYGKFLACEGYPECKTTKTINVEIDVPCPNCGEKLIQRRTKKGRTFYGCSGYPKCKTAFWSEPTSEKCPECGKLLVKAGKDKLKCSECDFKK